MASTVETGTSPVAGEHRFFLVATWIMAILTVGGFALQFAMGRSSLEVPLPYHLHAAIFMGFVALYVTQVTLAAGGHVQLHRRLGQISALWIPLMLAAGLWIGLVVLRVSGGPFFFGRTEFLLVNIFHLLAFGVLAFAGLRMRNRPDWHKRLMFGAMATVSIPGYARLLPLPLFIPYAFPIMFAVAAIFPLAGMVMDKRVHGRIHPAWWWALLLPLAFMLVGEGLVASGMFHDFVADFTAGHAGGDRPDPAFLPPDFAM